MGSGDGSGGEVDSGLRRSDDGGEVDGEILLRADASAPSLTLPR